MYVYKTTNLVNGKIYVGKHKRNRDIKNYLGSGKILLQAIDKYGVENFKKEILEHCKTNEQLNDREKHWISKLESRNKKIGYNIAEGGEGGSIKEYMTEEQLKDFSKKVSKGLKGKKLGIPLSKKNRDGISKGLKKYYDNGGKNNNLGKKRSAETKAKISKRHTGRVFTKAWKKKLRKSRAKLNISGKNNNMFGKTIYSVWLEKFGKKEADKKFKSWKENVRLAMIKVRKNKKLLIV